MRVLIVGNDLRTRILVKALISGRHKVVLVSDDQPFCESMANQTEHQVVQGDASHPDVLAAACAEQSDLLIAMLSSDADNLVICEMAKRKFGVQRTIAMVENPVNRIVFMRLGVDSVICAAEACSQLVENAIGAVS